jgi:hypothetical protein
LTYIARSTTTGAESVPQSTRGSSLLSLWNRRRGWTISVGLMV